MALYITEECIACDACVAPCPNQAISRGEPIYVIDPNKCTECVGAHDEKQCVKVCPVDCIIPDVNKKETQDELLAKYHKLHPA